MHSPIAASIWEIWTRRRISICFAVGLTIFGAAFRWVFQDAIRIAQSSRYASGFPLAASLLNLFSAVAWLILLLAIFDYKEFNPQTGRSGFPQRLFVLPVTSFQLIAVPMIGGAAVAGLTALAWMWHANAPSIFAVAVAAYLVIYQGMSWTLANAGPLRLILLGGVAFGFIATPIVYSWKGLPGIDAYALFVGLALLSFFTSWIWVARQRSGGALNLSWVERPVVPVAARRTRRRRPFGSAAAAQFWFEWRRSGFLLPALIGFLLLIFIGPVSWHFRNDADFSLRVLAATLAMPLLLAAPVGKAFSKPELWSADLALSAFIAVRPLATHEMVAIKMKVAAASAALSWLLVLIFLLLWLPFANLDVVTGVQFALRQSHILPIAILGVTAAAFLTWRFMVAGLWIGLSGNKALFAISAAPYALSPLLLIFFLFSVVSPTSWLRVWIRTDPDGFIARLAWIGVAAVITKGVLAVFSWRKVASGFVRQYGAVWIGATASLIILAVLLPFPRLRLLLIFGALLYIPLARIGLAVWSLDRNRHANI